MRIPPNPLFSLLLAACVLALAATAIGLAALITRNSQEQETVPFTLDSSERSIATVNDQDYSNPEAGFSIIVPAGYVACESNNPKRLTLTYGPSCTGTDAPHVVIDVRSVSRLDLPQAFQQRFGAYISPFIASERLIYDHPYDFTQSYSETLDAMLIGLLDDQGRFASFQINYYKSDSLPDSKVRMRQLINSFRFRN